uniref:CDGSH iron-sulfur domain-containing protein 2 n=1 Tax=Equus asinus asinus TaxID=83772 RepID=A0A8C4MIF2_EQUAS
MGCPLLLGTVSNKLSFKAVVSVCKSQRLSEWLRLLPFLGVLALLGYLAVRPFLPKKKQQKDSLINLKIQKENPKVVNEINIEDLCLTKAAYCRCWRSKTVRCPFMRTLTFHAVKVVLLLKSPVLRFYEMGDFSVVFSTESLFLN